eukprot:TRINITY_DN3796_c1_g3_i4.p1 TRINITY_DN3796_c1_g3~~TRINITY_DN3796_c1_g3_i4.p1  ORF type:complete len:275 (+),score=53.33 TRINITY_DN3796_c1_g3_i4:681-1505(+)
MRGTARIGQATLNLAEFSEEIDGFRVDRWLDVRGDRTNVNLGDTSRRARIRVTVALHLGDRPEMGMSFGPPQYLEGDLSPAEIERVHRTLDEVRHLTVPMPDEDEEVRQPSTSLSKEETFRKIDELAAEIRRMEERNRKRERSRSEERVPVRGEKESTVFERRTQENPFRKGLAETNIVEEDRDVTLQASRATLPAVITQGNRHPQPVERGRRSADTPEDITKLLNITKKLPSLPRDPAEIARLESILGMRKSRYRDSSAESCLLYTSPSPRDS